VIEPPGPIDDFGRRVGVDSHVPLTEAQLEPCERADIEPGRCRACAAIADAIRHNSGIGIFIEAAGDVDAGQARTERLQISAEADDEIAVVIRVECSPAAGTCRDVHSNERRRGLESVGLLRREKECAPCYGIRLLVHVVRASCVCADRQLPV
jgi:hypothetical protein